MRKTILLSLTAFAIPFSVAVANDKNQFQQDFLNGNLSWEQVEQEAKKEGKVNFYYWGGSDAINNWVDTVAVPAMKKKGIKLNPIRQTNPKYAIDLVLAEKSSGRGLGEGSVDTTWLNGENFANLKRNDALFGSFAPLLPNAKNFEFDANDPRAMLNLRDFGVMNDGKEAPWSGEQYICSYNTATVGGAVPKTLDDLKAYLMENSGRFTYVKPPHYLGNTFVQTVLYEYTPNGDGAESFQASAKEISASELAKRITPGMQYLRDIEPYLLGGKNGKVRYPDSAKTLDSMFLNKEIDFACKFGTYAASVGQQMGTYPDTGKQFIFPVKNMIKNKNFLAIPMNAPNPAATLVFINYMMSADAQATKLKMAGMPAAVDFYKMSSADAQKIKDAAPALIGVTNAELADNAVADTNATLVGIIEAVWLEYIERKSSSSIEEIVAKVYADMGY